MTTLFADLHALIQPDATHPWPAPRALVDNAAQQHMQLTVKHTHHMAGLEFDIKR